MPDSAFVIFESEKARNIILKPKNFMQIANEKIEFQRAPEPTDIIWENRAKESRLFKYVIGIVALFLLFSADLYATFAFNDSQLDQIEKYETKIDCTSFLSVNGIEHRVADQWQSYQQLENKPGKVPGLVSCFCQRLYKSKKNEVMGSAWTASNG